MSILTSLFPRPSAAGWAEVDVEENISPLRQEFSHLGYDPRFVKTYSEKIAEARSEDERICLAAQLAHSRSSGRHLGPAIAISYTPRADDGYDYPGRSALTWLEENGAKYGVTLHPTK